MLLSLEKHLKYWVDPEIDWGKHIRNLRAKGVSGDELRKRVGFCIATCRQRQLDMLQKVGSLTSGDKWAGYNEKEWNLLVDKLEVELKTIVNTQKILGRIPYIPQDNISSEAYTLQAYSSLMKQWDISELQAATAVSLYGANIIEAFLSNYQNKKNTRGLPNFVYYLHKWFKDCSIDPSIAKEKESLELSRHYNTK
jgi:hypothetical protein